MDWFRTDAGFTRHRDFIRLMKVTALPRHILAGHMVLLFGAVAEHEEYGDLSTTPDDILEEWAGWPTDRAGQFATALREVGWIRADGEFAGWIERHKTMLGARDKKRAERKKRGAKRLRGEKRDARGTDAGVPRDGRGTDAARRGTPRLPTVPTVPTIPVVAAPGELFEASAGRSAADLRLDLVAKWNDAAQRHGLPAVRASDATAWKDKADARISEGVLDRWGEIAAGIGAVMSQPRNTTKRPNWLTFKHVVANGQNWRSLAMDGQGATPKPATPKVNLRDVVREAVLSSIPEGGEGFYDGVPCRFNRGYHGELTACRNVDDEILRGRPGDRVRYWIDDDIEREIAPHADNYAAALEAAKAALARRFQVIPETTEAQSA